MSVYRGVTDEQYPELTHHSWVREGEVIFFDRFTHSDNNGAELMALIGVPMRVMSRAGDHLLLDVGQDYPGQKSFMLRVRLDEDKVPVRAPESYLKEYARSLAAGKIIKHL